jgi:RimJ/RimL family protein N-acetyltransferase
MAQPATAVLTTPRLLLRQFTTADADGLHALCGDPRTMRLVGDGTVLDRARCSEWIRECQANYAARGFGAWAVERRDSPGLAGYGGLVSARRRRDPELIYALRPELWGRGLGSELAIALTDHAFRQCGLSRLVATVRPENHASVRVLEKAGLHGAGEELGPEGIVMLIYAREAP